MRQTISSAEQLIITVTCNKYLKQKRRRNYMAHRLVVSAIILRNIGERCCLLNNAFICAVAFISQKILIMIKYHRATEKIIDEINYVINFQAPDVFIASLIKWVNYTCMYAHCHWTEFEKLVNGVIGHISQALVQCVPQNRKSKSIEEIHVFQFALVRIQIHFWIKDASLC